MSHGRHAAGAEPAAGNDASKRAGEEHLALLLRPMRAFRSGFVALGVIVLVATAGVVAWPAVTSALVTADARDRLAQSSVAARDITGTVPIQQTGGLDGRISSTADAIAAGLPGGLGRARREMQPALRSMTQPGRFVGRSDGISAPNSPQGLRVKPEPSDTKLSALGMSVEADQRLKTDDAVLVEGRWAAGGVRNGAIEVNVAAATAKKLAWKVGGARTVDLGMNPEISPSLGLPQDAAGRSSLVLRLVGTVKPKHPADDFWQLDPVRSRLGVSTSPDPNSKIAFYHGLAWIDQDAWPQLALSLGSPYVSAWYGVKPGSAEVGALPDIAAAATAFLANPIDPGAGSGAQPLRLSSQLPDIAQTISRREGPVPTLLAIVAVGPLGAAVAVLFVGARLMTSRRARELQLVRARGASERRVRGTLALQTAIVTVPAAVLGGAVATFVASAVLGTAPASAVLPIVVCAVVPPCAVAITASPQGATRRRPVTALIAELFVLALACASCVLLLQRGASAATDPTAIDPLLVATPLLVVFAVCVLVLRVYPAVLGLIGRGARSSRGAVSPVGWAAASRSDRGRVWPLFAMLTGVAVAVFAGTTFTTLVTSGEQDASARVGADVTVSAPLSAGQVRALQRIDGVATVAQLRLVGLGSTPEGANIPAYLVDVAKVSAAQSRVGEGRRLFPADAVASAARNVGGAVTVLGAVPGARSVRILTFDNTRIDVPVKVVNSASGSEAPFLTDAEWALLDEDRVPASLRAEATTVIALIGVRDGVDTSRVAAAAQRVAGQAAHVDSVAAEQDRQGQGPLLAGIQLLMIAGTVLALVMAVGALLLTLAMASGQRVRLLAVLRTLGFDRTQSAALVAWEVVPLAATAIVAGVIAGLGLSWLVVSAVDLRAVTGALARPRLDLSPAAIGLVVALFVVGTAVALLFAVASARRADPARTLRAAEEEL
ncbi:FtsX-like permease family protein [Rathayibacter sp. KR2-224]|uniref:FtsX-like permease family protein n=1 Tax=Rathayibacter sp. KR2-224 TaxID=3400913 RepID=UPI003C109CBF